MCALRCTCSLPVLYLLVQRFSTFKWWWKDSFWVLPSSPAAWCRVLLRVLQDRHDLKAAVLAYVHVLFGDGTKAAAWPVLLGEELPQMCLKLVPLMGLAAESLCALHSQCTVAASVRRLRFSAWTRTACGQGTRPRCTSASSKPRNIYT